MFNEKKFYTDVQIIGNNILYRGVHGGEIRKGRIPWRPTLFVPTNDASSEWHTVKGEKVQPTSFGDIYETRDFIKNHEGVSGFIIYGNTRLEYNFIAEQFPEDVIEWDKDQIRVANIDIEVISRKGFPDPKEAKYPVVSITCRDSKTGIYTVFGLKDYDVEGAVMETKKGPLKLEVTYRKFENESELLLGFIDYWAKELKYPHVVTGWNVKTFDIPYLVNRAKALLGDKAASRFSPWGIVRDKSGYFLERVYEGYSIIGVATLDYQELFWKFATKQMENWKLDYVCSVELGERKLSYEEFTGLPELYDKDHQKFISYNIRDVWLVNELDVKKNLLFLALMLAYDSHTNYEDVFAQVTMWDQICNRALLKKKIVIPPKRRTDKSEQYAGAYVKDPHPGLYRWIASFDLNSLYPHLIMQYNISPDTIIEPENYTAEMRSCVASGVTVQKLLDESVNLSFLPAQKATITPNGQFFRTDRHGFLPEIMDTMYKDRTKYKKMMLEAKKRAEAETDKTKKEEILKEAGRYDIMQNVKKVCLNSAYGALGNEYFRFFDIRQAEGITMGGQLAIRWIADRMNAYLNHSFKTEGQDYIIASDTDSMYLNLERLVDLVYGEKPIPSNGDVIKMLDTFCEKRVQPKIEENYKALAFYVNAYEQKMEMKRESLADKGIWTAPKRYIMNIYNKEGVQYAEPKVAITGLEVIKSNTPSACRKGMMDAIKIIMKGNEDELHAFSATFKKEFAALPVEEIAFPSGVKNLGEYADPDTIYGKKTPAHTRAALLYNHKLKTEGLTNKYQVIHNGEKIKWIYLKRNNPIGENVIAFMDIVPPEFGLDAYFDRSTQFQKAFVDKLEIITNCINWSVEKRARLDI
jgi:DNA polymerase elongation subunit (family B)